MTTTDTRWREFDVKDCPPSATVDKIVRWTADDGTLSIQPGDQVLRDGRFDSVASIAGHEYLGRVWLRVRYVNGFGEQFTDPGSLVAVRRYVEG